MSSCSRCVTIVCAVLSLAGCGDEAPSPALGGGGAGSGTAGGGAGLASGGSGAGTGSAGSSSTGGASGASAGQGSAAGTSAGGAVSCSNYRDADGYKLTVHIKNGSSGTLYLGPSESTCDAQSLFQVTDGANDLLASLAGCHTSCQTLMQTGPVTCPLACPTPSTLALNAGQTVDVPWDGRYAITQTLPAACMPASVTAPGTCVQAARIEPSAFTFSARAGKKRQCLDASGTCACSPNADGTCTAASSVISGTIITTELFMKLEPGDVNPGGSGPYIALEFKD